VPPARDVPAPAGRLRRLQSISGLLPLGVFLLFHLLSNLGSRSGADAYDAMARRYQRFPFALAIEILLIGAPLAFHSVYGLYLAATRPPGSPSPTRARRALSVLQRVTGVIVFTFLFFHLWTTRLVEIRDHESVDLFRLVETAVASPWIRGFYAVGIVAAALHLASGIWTAPETWGCTPGARGRIALGVGAVTLFLLITSVGLIALAGFPVAKP
jgi:succinate dehydrogenase / fumarate reductase, cytochrome b subunit